MSAVDTVLPSPAAQRSETALPSGLIAWMRQRGWTGLRQIQCDALRAWRADTADILIIAGTASGKTEAAWIPVSVDLARSAAGRGIVALGIFPTKALLNDQAGRLRELMGAVGLPVHVWHGDIATTERARIVANADGVLLTTPESLEGILRSAPEVSIALLRHVLVTVIDEYHMYLGKERGAHLRALLARAEAVAGRSVRRIALSATVGDIPRASAWLRGGAMARAIASPRKAPNIVCELRSYVPINEIESRSRAATEANWAADGDPVTGYPVNMLRSLQRPTMAALTRDVFLHHRDEQTSIVFANSRNRIERLAKRMAMIAQHGQMPPNWMLVHHGSLDRRSREAVETALRDGAAHCCLASSTLELGVDLGEIRAVGCLGSVPSVASLAQRLGRAGRRAEMQPVFRQYLSATIPVPLTDMGGEGMLQLDVVRAITVLALWRDGWIESPEVEHWHLSTAVHQILSIISRAEATPRDAIRAVLATPQVFPALAQGAILDRICDGLIASGHLRRIGAHALALGPAGTALIHGPGAYSAFHTQVQFEVVCQGESRGTLPISERLTASNGFILGGKSYHIIGIDHERRTIRVEEWAGTAPPFFLGSAPGMHDRIARAIRHGLASEANVPDVAMDPTTIEALQLGRAMYAQYRLDREIMTLGSAGTTLWAWRGERCLSALGIYFHAAGIASTPDMVSLRFPEAIPSEIVRAVTENGRDMAAVIRRQLAKTQKASAHKYDDLLPADVRIDQYMACALDIPAAQGVIDQIR